MLKHFQLGRKFNFPLVFLAVSVVLFGAGFFVLRIISADPSLQPKSTFELLLAATGAAAAFVYFLYNQHHQDMQMFVNLFEKFNKRYDSLNEKLNTIISRPIDSPLISEHINTLYDYFNLCAEEYLFYEAGYIDEKVWQAWLCGMNYFATDATVRRLWEEEIKSGSYYDFKLSLLDAAKCSTKVH